MLYTMRCTKCAHEFDVLRPICARNAPGQCPECGQMALRAGQEMTAGAAWRTNCPTASGGRSPK